jgi:hypothetical protein
MTAKQMMIRGLIAHEGAAGRFVLTDKGRAALRSWLKARS